MTDFRPGDRVRVKLRHFAGLVGILIYVSDEPYGCTVFFDDKPRGTHRTVTCHKRELSLETKGEKA